MRLVESLDRIPTPGESLARNRLWNRFFTAAPAVLNALSAALGRRVRSIPLKNQDLKKT